MQAACRGAISTDGPECRSGHAAEGGHSGVGYEEGFEFLFHLMLPATGLADAHPSTLICARSRSQGACLREY